MKGRTIILHIIIWTFFVALHIAFLSNFPAQHHISPIKLTVFVIFFIIVFYVHTELILPHLFKTGKMKAYMGVMATLFLLTMIVKPFDRIIQRDAPALEIQQPSPNHGDVIHMEKMDGKPGPENGMRFDIISVFIFLIVCTVGILKNSIVQNRINEQKALAAESEKLKAELAFLRAQINPHFLFNTLNNIYALALQKKDETPDSILKLSQIMRYVLDNTSEEWVDLDEEIKAINNYIDLQKIRLNENTQVAYHVEGSTFDHKIIPLIFMSFIENAFKHGISSHSATIIIIKINITSNSISLQVENNIFSERAEQDREGIGLTNTIKRLEHYYGSSYLLHTGSKNNTFTISLTLNKT